MKVFAHKNVRFLRDIIHITYNDVTRKIVNEFEILFCGECFLHYSYYIIYAYIGTYRENFQRRRKKKSNFTSEDVKQHDV